MRILYTLGALALLVSCTSESTKPVQCHITGTVIDRLHLWSQYGCQNAAGRKFLLDKAGTIIAIDPTVEELTAILKDKLSE